MRIREQHGMITQRFAPFIHKAGFNIPLAIDLGINNAPTVFAAGAELKAAFCLTKDGYAILGPTIGDMRSKEAIIFYKEGMKDIIKAFEIDPDIIAHDLHPNYWTTQFAKQISDSKEPPIQSIQVQHHHAHIASCMAEHGIRGNVLGVAMDGTGYGQDGKIWGGEFLIADETDFERFAHLEYMPMPGGEMAIKEPFRMAFSYIYHTFEGGYGAEIEFAKRFDQGVLKTFIDMMRGKINSPLTSSCGRLFDAVSSIIGIKDIITFEGEAAISMERVASANVSGSYGFEIKGFNPYIIDVKPMIKEVVEDASKGKAISDIAGAFHNTIADIILAVSKNARRDKSIDRVILTGGCFQNALLLGKAVPRLADNGFHVFTHRVVPPNDGGICIGQALIASSMAKGI